MFRTCLALDLVGGFLVRCPPAPGPPCPLQRSSSSESIPQASNNPHKKFRFDRPKCVTSRYRNTFLNYSKCARTHAHARTFHLVGRVEAKLLARNCRQLRFISLKNLFETATDSEVLTSRKNIGEGV